MLPPLSWVSLFFISGLVFAELSNIPLSASVIITALATLIWAVLSLMKKQRSFLVRKHRHIGISPALILIAFLTGILRYQVATHPFSYEALALYNDKGVVTVTGDIYGFPDRRDTFQLITVKVDRLSSLAGKPVGVPVLGRVIVRTGVDIPWSYGDSIQMTGRLVTPPDEADFSYRDYLSRRAIESSLYYPEIIMISRDGGSPLVRWIFEVRTKSLSILNKFYPMPESALLSGILLGVDSGIPEDIQKAFQATGTTHIIAISGFNFSVLAALVSNILFRLFGARKGAMGTTLVLAFYVILTGASPSVIRAAIMGGLGLFASLIGRRQTGINSLAFVAAVMCMANPYLPWDVSFQLSFLSTLGLILFAEPMVGWLKVCISRLLPARYIEPVAEKIGEYCLFTMAALITTFPVMAFHFQSFSWSSLITNPLVLPAQPAVMILGGLSLLLGFLWAPLGKLISYLAWPFVAYTIKTIEWISNLTDNSPATLSIGMGFVLFYYLILILAFSRQKLTILRRLFQPNLIIVIGLAITAYAWRYALSLPDKNLHLYLLENGPSENVLIRSPGGEYLLFNAGSKSIVLANSLGQLLPPTNRHLDYVFLPVFDKTSIRALRHGFSGVTIDNLVWLGEPSGSTSVRDLQNSIDVTNISSSKELEWAEYHLAPGIIINFYDLGFESGGVFLLVWDNFRLVLPIHIDNDSWLATPPISTLTGGSSVILLAGNGDVDSNPPALVRRLNPSLILINADVENPEAMTVFNLPGSFVLTTQNNGWVHLTTNGEQLWVEVSRNQE
jgi:competence protein ComEC